MVQFGIGDDTFYPPKWEIPTKVYRDSNGKFTSKQTTDVVYPIVNGNIKDLNAFLYFLKLIYKSAFKKKSMMNLDFKDIQSTTIPMILLSHYSWSSSEHELITQYVFETIRLGYLMILPVSLSTSYAFGSIQNCLIIDIGAQSTDIMPIVDYSPLNCLSCTLNMGGNAINEKLSQLLPHIDQTDIEYLKCSPIFEVLSQDAKARSKFNFDELPDENEGSLDIAAIVTSTRSTRELLEEREREKNKVLVDNNQLESNVFFNKDGNPIVVGKQRFQGCESLIKEISRLCGLVLSQIGDPLKLKSIWENVLIIGSTSSIKGFKEALLVQLCEDHLKLEPEAEKHQREHNAMQQFPKQKKSKYMHMIGSIEYSQVPNSIKIPKFPEYFPEWKKYGYGEAPFLGAQIVSKQVFGHGNESFYITRDKYDEKGPSIIWDVSF